MHDLAHGSWVTDGGLETDLLFNHGVDLPEFASFPLIDVEEGTALLESYYAEYAAIAAKAGAGLLLETPTWRANPDWAAKVGYDAVALDRVNRAAVDLVRRVADRGDDRPGHGSQDEAEPRLGDRLQLARAPDRRRSLLEMGPYAPARDRSDLHVRLQHPRRRQRTRAQTAQASSP